MMMIVNGLASIYGRGEEKRSSSQKETESHYVWDLLPEQQMKLISIKIQVLNKAGRPIQNAHVVGYCQPWHYRTEIIFSNKRGEANIRGPIGNWTFFAAAPHYLMLAHLKTQEDCRLKIKPDREYKLELGVKLGSQPKKQLVLRQDSNGRLGFIQFQPSNRLIPMLPLGFVTGKNLPLESTEGIEGSFWITRDMKKGIDGLMFASPCKTIQSEKIPIFYNDPARLRAIFDGYGRGTRVVLNIYPEEALNEVGRSAFIVPSSGGQAELLLSPGTYRVEMGIPGSESVVFLGKRLTFQPGETKVLRYGNQFSVKPMVLTWNQNRIDLWFHIEDIYGNAVYQFVTKRESVKLLFDNKVLYEGPLSPQRTRHLSLDRDWSGIWNQGGNLHFVYQAACQPIGTVRETGSFRNAPNLALGRNGIPVCNSTDHFNIRFLNCPLETTERVASALERSYEWLSTAFAGPVEKRGGNKWDVRSAAPGGVGWAGDGIAVSIYTAETDVPTKINGGTTVLFHEFGHIYQSSPPNHQAKGVGTNTCESIATLISEYCMRAIHGETGRLFMVMNFSRSFFNRRLDPKATITTNADDYDFIFNYVHSRFGEHVNRQFVKIMYRSEGNLETALVRAHFLKSEGERVAAIYSFLTRSNLAWLFRWAGEDVADSTIDQAMAYFDKIGAAVPE